MRKYRIGIWSIALTVFLISCSGGETKKEDFIVTTTNIIGSSIKDIVQNDIEVTPAENMSKNEYFHDFARISLLNRRI